jgi:uncharacterized protein
MEMPPPVARFYEAMHRADAQALLGALAGDFVGHVTDGLAPLGGTHTGPKEMLRRAWLPAHRIYGALPYPEDCLEATDGRVVVLGRYRGTPPATGRPFEAVFTHVFRLRDGVIAEARQITDSHSWIDAADASTAESAIARQVFDAVRSNDAALLLDAYAGDIVIEESPALPYGGTFHGREGAMRHGIGFSETWDALQCEDERDPRERLLQAPGAVVALWTLRATRGDERLAHPAASVMQIRDGKVSHLRMLYHDAGAILRFLAR